MVIWLIGLSGAGKSTLAEEMVRLARERGINNLTLVDGDVIREVFGNDLGHSLEDRRTNAGRVNRLCAWLESEGVHVVCSILSIFEESRQWNREHLKNYFEVFIDTPIETLIQRDGKGLYKKALAGELQDVAGVDLEFPKPSNPDLVIDNSQGLQGLLAYAPQLVETLQNS